MFDTPDEKGLRLAVPPTQQASNNRIGGRPRTAGLCHFEIARIPDERSAEALRVAELHCSPRFFTGAVGVLGVAWLPEDLKTVNVAGICLLLRTIPLSL